MKTASSVSNLGVLKKIQYSLKLLKMKLTTNKDAGIIPWRDIREYEHYLEKYASKGFENIWNNEILEIGYGARPWRLFSMASLGAKIKGIDLDQPAYGFNAKRLLKILKNNGIERFSKSLIRGTFFDGRDLQQLKKELKTNNATLKTDASLMVVGNVAESKYFQPSSFSFVYSEDVFEHIPKDILPAVVNNLHLWMKPGGIALIRPHVFTGIAGSHMPSFYTHEVVAGNIPKDRAWEHLLDPNFKVNTFVNKVTFDEYVSLFSEKFEIIEIKHRYPELGKQYLTDDLKARLIPPYSLNDLFSNQVAFVLKKIA